MGVIYSHDNKYILGGIRIYMFIINKDGNDMYNMAHVVNIYRDECTIKVCAGSATRGGVLGKYNSYDDALLAYSMLINGIKQNNNEVFIMPSDKDLPKKTTAYHHPTGKKTKGHGGS